MKRRRGALAAASAISLALLTPAIAHADSRDTFEKTAADVKAAMLADPRKAIDLGQAALAYARQQHSSHMQATALWLLGEANLRVNETQRALTLLSDAQRLAERSDKGTHLEADILLSLGSARTASGEVALALTNLHQAHELFRSLGDDRSRAKALIGIALLYNGGNDYVAALRYFDQAKDVYSKDPGLSLAIYNGRGSAFKDLKRFPEAEAQYALALQTARGMSSDFLVTLILSNVARVRLMQHDLPGADRAISEGMALSQKPNAIAYHPLFQVLAAQSAFEHHRLAQARELIDARFRGVDLDATDLTDRDAHDVAYRVYSALGEDSLALKHLAALKRLDDRATELARSNSAALASAQFDFANQELRITKLKAEDLQKTVAFERERANTQRLVFIGAGAATTLIITLLAFGIVTLRRSRNRLAISNAALAKALAAKTEFLATTSHEIRTPLNGILGMTQVMLADERLDAATRDRLSVVHGAGVNMRALVDDILDVAKMETGRMTIEEAPFDLRQLMRDATGMWAEQARGKGLAFDLTLTEGPQWIVGDATRLRQIIFNLLSNAVKFTPTGSINVGASVDGDRWRLSVTDSGIGISPDKHEEIFEAFRQADAGTTRQYGGTGLGLAICRNLSRAMGGEVTVESRLEAGSTFTLDLPLVRAEAPAVDGVAAGEGMVVVDRNPITRAMFKTLFEPRAGKVTFAGSIGEALGLLDDGAPQVILLDDATLRQHADPHAAIAELRGKAGGATLALLGPAGLADERDALQQAGIDKVIVKPIARDELLITLFDKPSAALLVSAAA